MSGSGSVTNTPVIKSDTSNPGKNESQDQPKEIIKSKWDFIIDQLEDIQRQVNNSRPTILKLLLTGHILGFFFGVLVIIGLLSNGSRTIVFSILGSLCSMLCIATTFGKWYYRQQKREEWREYMLEAAKINAGAASDMWTRIFVGDFRFIIENSINVILFILRAICIYFLMEIPVEYLKDQPIGGILIGSTVFGCILDGVGIKMSCIVLSLSNDPVTHVGLRMESYIKLLKNDNEKQDEAIPSSSNNNQG